MSALILIPIATFCLGLYKSLKPDPLPPPLPPEPPPLPPSPPRRPTKAEIVAAGIRDQIKIVESIAAFKGTEVPDVSIRGRSLKLKFDEYLDNKIGDVFDHPDKAR